MTSLIERIEAATGPDQELDALIWCTLNGKKYVGWFDPNGEEGRATAVEYTEPPKRTILVTHSRGHAPLYTSSIDAAMTLVPEDYMILNMSDIAFDGLSGVHLVSVDKPDAISFGTISLATALCAAALRARGVM